MSLETAVKEFIDPHSIFKWIRNVEVLGSGRIYKFSARNVKTDQRMFLQQGVKICFDFCMPIGYDMYDPDGYEYQKGLSIIYLTPKQWTFLQLNQ